MLPPPCGTVTNSCADANPDFEAKVWRQAAIRFLDKPRRPRRSSSGSAEASKLSVCSGGELHTFEFEG